VTEIGVFEDNSNQVQVDVLERDSLASIFFQESQRKKKGEEASKMIKNVGLFNESSDEEERVQPKGPSPKKVLNDIAK